jgi:hypothetical protein
MYIAVMEKYNSTFYAYANSDILFVNDLVETLLYIAQSEIDKKYSNVNCWSKD